MNPRPPSGSRRVIAAAGIALLALAACGSSESNLAVIEPEDVVGTTSSTTTLAPEAADKPEVVIPEGPAPTELVIEDLIVGEGAEAKPGDYLVMHYVGVRHSDGGQFDASWDRGSTFPVTLGAGRVIPGWDEGLVGMQEGGRRQLTIPPDLAYGDQEVGADIPAGSTLVFVVDLVDLVAQPLVENAPEPVTELEVTVLEEGDGDVIEAGDLIEMHYVALAQPTGRVFDSSFVAGQPIRFVVAAEPSQAIPAWDEAFVGASVGDHLRMVIPPDKGIANPDGTVIGPDDTIVVEAIVIRIERSA